MMTIIVLLILAVVAITSISKSNIIKHAQNSKEAFEQGKVNETEIINSYEQYIKNNISTPSSTLRKFYLIDGSVRELILKENNKYEMIIYNSDGIIESDTSSNGTYTEENGKICFNYDGDDLEFSETTYTIGSHSYKGIKEKNNILPPFLKEIPQINEEFIGNTYKSADNEQYTVCVALIKDTNEKYVYLKMQNEHESKECQVFFDGNDIYEFDMSDEEFIVRKCGTFTEDGTKLTKGTTEYIKQ